MKPTPHRIATGVFCGFVGILLTLGTGRPARAAPDEAPHTTRMYRWVDAGGRVHFSDRKHPGATPFHVREDDIPADRGGQEAAAAGTATRCRSLREQLASYRKASSVTAVDPLGNEHVYDAEEKKQLLARTQAEVDAVCGEAGMPAGEIGGSAPTGAEPALSSPAE